ncbi:hypothetical protein K7432_011797 [Basidiobolus ranarum]|uniref:Ribosome maturation protein SDO1/SBDS N-terminal domain-containing protein n=1 Tax=Basidiobolus ranarum TaxID=34480 RepID=A0ABR2VTA6_9FUNG
MVATQKIVYSNPEKSDKEFFVYVHADIYADWKDDKSVPVTDVIQAYNVYTTHTGGNTGVVIAPTKSDLEKVFGFSHDAEVVEFILNHGTAKGVAHSKTRGESEHSHGSEVNNGEVKH